jgi:predicted ribosome quality control (RQC) complex YloA/Tae2 family protein
MEVKNLSSLDLFCVVRELQSIREAKVEKIYQPTQDELVFALYHAIYGKLLLRIISGKAVYLSKYKKDYKQFPPHFCMFLRKHLSNARVRAVAQKQGDRIIEIEFSTKEGVRKLFCELFSPGNFVLCDADRNIIALKQVQVFRDRKIMVHKPYELPEKKLNPLMLNMVMFKRALSTSRMGNIVKALASEVGLGGKYAEEICLRAGVDKEKPLTDLTKEDYEKAYLALDAFVRKLKYKPYEPSTIYDGDNPIDYQPVPFDYYSKHKKEDKSSFNVAVDEYYTKIFKQGEQEEKEKAEEVKVEKFEKIKEKQEERIEELVQESEEKRGLGEELMQKIALLEQVRVAVLAARAAGDSWDEIKNKLEVDRQKGVKAAFLIEDIDPATRTFKVKDVPVPLSIDSSVGSQTSKIYDSAKQAEAKAERAQEQVVITEDKITAAEEQPIEPVEYKEVVQREYANWYEKFKYFFTSNNKLVVCGKDAVQNEILIKRYLRNDDVVFHADLVGSPFGLLRGEGEHDKIDLEEAAVFIASHSRAWREGFATADVYWVTPSQVSKESGLQKGSFMIYGRRNYFYGVELKLAVGVMDGIIVSGPESAVKSKSSNYYLIKPGDLTQNETARRLAEKLGVQNFDEIVQHLPAGDSKIFEKPVHFELAEKKPDEVFDEKSDDEFEKVDERAGKKDSFDEGKSFLDEEIEKKIEEAAPETEETEEDDFDDFDYDDFSF